MLPGETFPALHNLGKDEKQGGALGSSCTFKIDWLYKGFELETIPKKTAWKKSSTIKSRKPKIIGSNFKIQPQKGRFGKTIDLDSGAIRTPNLWCRKPTP